MPGSCPNDGGEGAVSPIVGRHGRGAAEARGAWPVEDEQFRELMDAVNRSNTYLRSIQGWLAVLGLIALFGVLIGFVAWLGSVS